MKIPLIEKATTQAIQECQWTACQQLLAYVDEKSVFYQQHFERHHITRSDIRNLHDLSLIPTVSKKDLQQYGKDFWCASPSEIIEYSSTSGTEGQPITIPLTENDLDRLAYNEMISFLCAGGSPAEIYQLTTTVDRRFMAGLAYALGARKLGAGIIRVGPGLPQLQWDTVAEVKPTAFIIVPSFLLKIIEYAEENGIDYQASSIKKAICIGEPIRNRDFSLNALGQRIRDKWNIALYATYASTEMATAFTECEAGEGGHLHPELIIAEILDDQGHTMPGGEPGELTITTLGTQGLPLIRFRTGDICTLHQEPCVCGRTTPRLGPVLGRKNQMIKCKGTTCYPPALFEVLHSIPSITHYQVVVSSDEFNNDEVLVRFYSPEEPDEHVIRNLFKTRVRFTPRLEMISEQEILSLVFPRTSRKPVRFVDHRNK